VSVDRVVWLQAWRLPYGFEFDVLHEIAGTDEAIDDDRPLVIQIDADMDPAAAARVLRDIADDLDGRGYRPSPGRQGAPAA
jgi:hypothetical protein